MENYYWLIAFAVLLIFEISTMGLTTIWFAIGAICAFFAAVLGGNLMVQVIVFIGISILSLILTRPLVKKHFNNSREATNVYSLIGQQGLVIIPIDTLRAEGRVEVKGQEWAAKTESPHGKIETGTEVEVKRIEGVHLIVERKENV
ncbi:membrane protein implicated in regulation of membrane protease activity [Aequitasia blattaphilus]|uniref:NfeD family protein n=1 Tax=Aequitasia blattaphilus TaxID=2949332 RepID=A0ABT1E5D9_9FIRM|nr:NfeD family protein [Aequitasia blattaphilus]MCP1101048.1 NfeD family protein [Aequitasia blattaphilus]MCR8613688.1 NfeD family protein [Aequitasia blattaphilus]